MKKATKTPKITLEDVVKLAHEAGAQVSVSLGREMPMRFPDDPEPIKLLVEESERCSKLGNDWLNAKVPNQIAGELCLRNGWAYALAASWLRCKLKGEFDKPKDS